MRAKDIWHLLKSAFFEWHADKVPRLGAALAFYTVFSLAPLLVIAIAVGGLVFGEDAAHGRLSAQMRGMLGKEGALAVEEIMAHSARRSGQGTWASALGAAALIFGASGVFGQLKDALNLIWEVEPKPDLSWWWTVRERVISFAMVGCIGFLLLVSLVFSALIGAASDRMADFFSVPPRALYLMDWTVTLGIITLLFAIIYTTLPDAIIPWRYVWIGAFITAILFTFGKTLIGLYLGNAAVGSAFGAAGSLAIVMLWTYYSAQIVLFGAELTEVYARFSGWTVVPAPHARRIPCPEPHEPSRPLPDAPVQAS
jgi:membrane protein